MDVIYFDHSATTRVCPEAAAALQATLCETFGNPSSRHPVGRQAAEVMREARAAVLAALGEGSGQIVFTAGGTEANNLAILGRAEAKPRLAGGRILTTDGEHASVEAPLARLEARGYEVVRIPTVGGVLDPEALKAACGGRVLLASFMLVNNETGALYDVASAAATVHRLCPDAVVHTDATQAFLKVPCTPRKLGVDMMTLSGHKIGAVKGIGALWVSDALLRARGLAPRILGGGQEGDLRSGTENMPGIAAMGAAARAGAASFGPRTAELARLRDGLCDRILSDPALGEVRVNEAPVRAPHILSLTVPRLPSETLLNFLSSRGICVSAGSACSSHAAHAHASRALLAFGLTAADADATVRLSFGPGNTEAEAEIFVAALKEALATLYRRR